MPKSVFCYSGMPLAYSCFTAPRTTTLLETQFELSCSLVYGTHPVGERILLSTSIHRAWSLWSAEDAFLQKGSHPPSLKATVAGCAGVTYKTSCAGRSLGLTSSHPTSEFPAMANKMEQISLKGNIREP